MYYKKGDGENKKLARRQLHVIEGNIASYSRCLNSSKRMEAKKDHHKLAAAVDDISADQAQYKANYKKESANKVKANEDKERKVTDELK